MCDEELSVGALPRLVQPLLLLLILDRPGHGYELTERLTRLGIVDVEPPRIYRILHELERRSLVASGWEASVRGPSRRCYQLTAAGRAELAGWVGRFTRLDGLLDTCLKMWAHAEVGAPGAS
jgi:poly-beta-hydroxybutyrate-responsive repressor